MPVSAGAGDPLPGDIYEDCFYPPCRCTGTDESGHALRGISLIDGSCPRSCDLPGCGVRTLSAAEAWQWKPHGPPDVEPDAATRGWR